MTIEKFKIPVSMLSPSVDPAQLGFDDTSELEPLNEIIGQERAVEALEFGLHMKGPDENIINFRLHPTILPYRGCLSGLSGPSSLSGRFSQPIRINQKNQIDRIDQT